MQIVNLILTFRVRKFYESDEAIPFEQHHFKPSPGHYIAFYGKEDKTWYRGLIRGYKRPNLLEVSLKIKIRTNHKSPSLEQVLYLDYGTVLDVHLDDVRYLAPQFKKLNAQAMMARLSAIRPIGDEWCAEARQLLHNEAKMSYAKGDLMARLDGYITSTEGCIASLNIRVLNKRKDFSLMMVKRKFAQYARPAMLNDHHQLNATEKVELQSYEAIEQTEVRRPQIEIQKILQKKQAMLLLK